MSLTGADSWGFHSFNNVGFVLLVPLAFTVKPIGTRSRVYVGIPYWQPLSVAWIFLASPSVSPAALVTVDAIWVLRLFYGFNDCLFLPFSDSRTYFAKTPENIEQNASSDFQAETKPGIRATGPANSFSDGLLASLLPSAAATAPEFKYFGGKSFLPK